MRTTLFFIVSAILTLIINCRNSRYSSEVESRIKQVENNLAGWVLTGTDDRWNIPERMKKYGVNGVSVAVIHNYRIEWAKGYGMADMADKRPVTENTLFQAASISKSLNSIGVLRLVEKKMISCDSDINKYLVSWKFPYDSTSHGRKITIKKLLSHTAGLSIHGFPGYGRREERPAIVQVLNGEKPSNTAPVRSVEEPGKHVIYSGGGTTILQLIVTDITGTSYEAYMQREVLDKLGMISSCYCQPPDGINPGLLATGYKTGGDEVPGKYHVYPEMAAAGLWTNPTDLCRYVIETQLAWKGESHKVLSPEMTRFRLTPILEDAALGTFVNSRVTGSYKYFNHNGGNEGFSCTAIGCRDSGDGVVIMINSESWPIIEEITNSVATVYEWKDYYLPEIKKIVNVNDTLLKKYAGKYDVRGTVSEFQQTESGPVMRIPGEKVPWKVYFTTDSDFFVRESRGMATFCIDGHGKVTGFSGGGEIMKKIE